MTKSKISTPARDFDLDDWIASGTVAQRTVELHNDRAIPDHMARLERERQIAAAVAEDQEQAVTDVPDVARIDAELERLFEAWQASKETWTVRALSLDEIRALRKRHPGPKMPAAPKKTAPKTVKDEHEKAMAAWADEATEARDAADLEYISWAIVSFVTARGALTPIGEPVHANGSINEDFVPAVTADQLRAIRARAGRQGDIVTLMQAVNDALQNDAEVPAPFSQRTSRTDRT